MRLMPKLVGAIEVRERRPRYEGEPRRKRLEFIRPKTTTDTDEWPLIKTYYPRPQPALYGAPWQHPDWNQLSFEQRRLLLAENAYGQPQQPLMYHHYPYYGHVPAPPLLGEPPERKQIGGAEPHEPIVRIVTDHEDDYSDIQEIKPKKRRAKKSRPSGHSIFDSDSDNDDRYGRRHRSALSIYSSSEGSSFSRPSRQRGHRGWGG